MGHISKEELDTQAEWRGRPTTVNEDGSKNYSVRLNNEGHIRWITVRAFEISHVLHVLERDYGVGNGKVSCEIR